MEFTGGSDPLERVGEGAEGDCVSARKKPGVPLQTCRMRSIRQVVVLHKEPRMVYGP